MKMEEFLQKVIWFEEEVKLIEDMTEDMNKEYLKSGYYTKEEIELFTKETLNIIPELKEKMFKGEIKDRDDFRLEFTKFIASHLD